MSYSDKLVTSKGLRGMKEQMRKKHNYFKWLRKLAYLTEFIIDWV